MSAAQSSAPAAAASARAPFKKRARGELDPADETDEQKQASAHVSPVARLYRHALESIFAFLPLADLSCVLRVSRSWSAALRSMRSIHATVYEPTGRCELIASSGLAHHVGQIGVPGDAHDDDAQRPTLTINDLMIFSQRLGSLTSLACAVEMPQPSRLIFAPSLRTLDVRLNSQDPGVINAAIGVISRLPNLTDLTLELPNCYPALSFTPLADTAQLQSLTLYRHEVFVNPTLQQLDQLRSLSRLRKMTASRLSSHCLAYLLRLPHSLQWQEIHRSSEIDDVAAAALSTLPSLTKLDTYVCRSVAFLPALTRLRSLELSMDPAVRLAADITAGLSCCPELTELMLRAVDVTSAHLSQALCQLPLLRKLSVVCCDALESLSFLSECTHLAQSLQSLNLYYCRNAALHSTELSHVLTLKNLTELTLFSSFAESLTAPTLQSLQPPSLALPALTQFVHSNY